MKNNTNRTADQPCFCEKPQLWCNLTPDPQSPLSESRSPLLHT